MTSSTSTPSTPSTASTSTTTSTPGTAGATLPLVAGRWAVDHAHSSMGFVIRHLGISKVRGRFTGFDAEVVIGETLDTTTVTATVDLATVDTDNADRDAHLRQPDLLDIERRPTMTFRSTGVRAAATGDGDGDGDGIRGYLDGELTMGGVGAPLCLAVELGGIEDFPMGGPRHAGFEATGEIRRSDYGIGPQFPAAVLGDVVKIQIDLELLEP